MAIQVGTKAPDLTLKSKSPADRDVILSQNFGKQNTVLLFFPLAFTGVCTTEMCDVTSGLGKFKELNAEVIAGLETGEIISLEQPPEIAQSKVAKGAALDKPAGLGASRPGGGTGESRREIGTGREGKTRPISATGGGQRTNDSNSNR